VGVDVVPFPFPFPFPLEGGGAVAVPCSITVATISVSLFKGTELDTGKSVITVPLGARSGTLSHAEADAMSPTIAAAAQ
jgi:hypothetical protein